MGFNFNINGLTSKDIASNDVIDKEVSTTSKYLVPGERYVNIIPALSSNNDKGFLVTADVEPTEQTPMYYCFDHKDGTLVSWLNFTTSNTVSVTIECDKKYLVDKYLIGASTNDTYGPTKWQFMASNDNYNWNLLDICTTQKFDHLTSIVRDITPRQSYKYFKIIFLDGGQYSNLHVKSIGLFTLESNLGQQGLKSILPVMKSVVQDGYEASASSSYAPTPPFCVFCKDNVRHGRWLCDLTPSNQRYPQWIQIKLPTEKLIKHYQVTQYWYEGYSSDEQSRNVKSFDMQGSMDGVNFETFDSVKNLPAVTFLNRKIFRTLAAPVCYKYYRCSVTERMGASATGIHIQDIDLFE